MRFLYNIIFLVFFCLSAPFYFLKMWRRGNWRKGFRQRFGRFDGPIKQALTNRDILWFHAVSVGEVNICTQLIKALETRMPNLKIVVSTTTSTGMGELQKKLPSHIEKIYYPIDYRRCALRALGTIHPKAIILVEAEIWPNFLWAAEKRGTPVFLVNARLSARSFRGYRIFGFLFRPLFRSMAGVGCQNEADAERLRRLGCRPEAVKVVGNLKFDAARIDERRLLDVTELLGKLGVDSTAKLLVAGSTHAGEEGILADIYLRLRERFPDLFLVLVPRHFERGKEVGREMAARGLKFAYRSEMTANTRRNPGDVECLVVNSTGELKYFYEQAAVVFVGKSLTAEGGQNPIEPGALGKAMVFGPNMQNFISISDLLVHRGGAVRVKDSKELETALADLLANEPRRLAMGRNAQTVIRENQGSIEKTVEMIIRELPFPQAERSLS